MKAYTNLKQSKKLEEFLPIESADMYYPYFGDNKWGETARFGKALEYSGKKDVSCWSLTALLDLLDDVVINDEGVEYSLTISKEEGMYYIHYHDRWEEVSDIETDCYYDLIDACYEMILELHELNLL